MSASFDALQFAQMQGDSLDEIFATDDLGPQDDLARDLVALFENEIVLGVAWCSWGQNEEDKQDIFVLEIQPREPLENGMCSVFSLISPADLADVANEALDTETTLALEELLDSLGHMVLLNSLPEAPSAVVFVLDTPQAAKGFYDFVGTTGYESTHLKFDSLLGLLRGVQTGMGCEVEDVIQAQLFSSQISYLRGDDYATTE